MKYGLVITILVVLLIAAAIILGIWWFLNNEDQLDAETSVRSAFAIMDLAAARAFAGRM